MNVTVGGQQYRVGFQYEPDWVPESGVLQFKHEDGYGHTYTQERFIQGRVSCRIMAITRDPQCERHGPKPTPGGGVLAGMVPCSCVHGAETLAPAYCSIQDDYDPHIGRKRAFAKALLEMFPADRAARRTFWLSFLTTIKQPMRTPTRAPMRPLTVDLAQMIR